MRTHVTGWILLAICGALLALDTRLYLSGQYAAVLVWTGTFLVIVAILAVLIALVPAVRTAFTTD